MGQKVNSRGPAVVVRRPAGVTAPARTKLRQTVVEDNLLSVMANQETFRNEFPFLKDYATTAKSCSSCDGRRKLNDASARARRAIVSLDSTKRARLKELLNTEKVTVYLTGPDGRRQAPITF